MEVREEFRLGSAVGRRQAESTLAVSFAALLVAAISLLLAADALREQGAEIAAESLLAGLLALLVIFVVASVNVRLASARRREQANDARLRDAMARMDGIHGFAHALAMALEQVRDLLGAQEAALATHELGTGRTFLGKRSTAGTGERASFSDLDTERRAEYLFQTSADAWLARRLADGRWDVVALGAEGSPLAGGDVLPTTALDGLSRRLGTDRLAGLDVRRDDEWRGRVIAASPRWEAEPDEPLQLAQRFVRGVTGVLHSRFLLGRLRARVGAMERGRIARDLHDGTIQALVAIEMELELLRRNAETRGSPAAAELARVKGLLHDEILDVRDTMQRLARSEIDPRELVGFLDAGIARFERESGIHAIFDCEAEDVDLAPRVCREVARIVQEALQNVRKHSRARNVVVRFERAPAGWRLVVDDDGQGFPFAGAFTDAQLHEGRKGPYVIKERVQALGGELHIVTGPGRGARLEILLPEEAQ
jgi:signal transduction histidine kinase